MRAHFASEDDKEEVHIESKKVQKASNKQRSATFVTDDVELHNNTLDKRINEFKRESQNVCIVEEFIDDVLNKAEAEVEKQQAQQEKSKVQSKDSKQAAKEKRASFNIPDFKNGKVVNRARGLVVRLFDAICNCANTAAAPATRIKLRGKRAATLNGTSSSNTDAMEDNEKLDKNECKDKLKKEKSDEHLEQQRNTNNKME